MPWVDETPRRHMPGRVGAAGAALYGDEPPGERRGLVGRVRNLVRAGLPRGAVILGTLFVVNAGSGFLAKKVLAHVFGAGPETDALTSATYLVSFPVTILVLGGVVGPFLPLFVGLKDEAEEAAREFARTILTAALITVGLAIAALFILAPQIASIAVPGFEASERDLYVNLVRVVCAGQLAIAASMVLGEVLVAERRWWTYGLAEFASYAGLAAGAFLLGGPMGIYGAAIGSLVGGLAHLGVRLVGIYRTTFRPRLSLSLRTKGVGEFAWLILPRMASSALVWFFAAYFTRIASTLAPGSTTSVAYAQDFQSTAENVVGVAFALAAFPALSAAAAAGDRSGFRRIFRTNFLTIAFFSILAAAALAALAGFIAGLFKGGAFDDTDASRLTLVLVILAISVPFESLVELLARAIMATHNTLEPTIAVLVGFIAGVVVTTTLSTGVGLAALPIGYVTFQAVRVIVLGLFLRPRMSRIGAISPWSWGTVWERWGAAVGGTRRAIPAGRLALIAIVAVALGAGTVFAGSQALGQVAIGGGPQITPWARVGGTRAPVIAAGPSVTAVAPSASASASSSATLQPTLAPSMTPGVFAMDLYQPGDFVSEFVDTWCVPAAMQTSMNIMSVVPDATRDTQAKLQDLAFSLGGGYYGGADPNGWAKGLASLGYGNYQVGAKPKMADALHVVVKQIRLTGRPAGLLVWKGWHSWVVSGFTATADPAQTDTFTIISVRIEDVWYPRVSKLWPKSRPPDANVPVGALGTDYVPWHQAKIYSGREGNYVYVIPVA
ncbi:MAG: lipid II flippase MurJ [Candidatus Limnocylindrales bacterium]